ncbi:MAG: L-aspartate oxidase [Catonella sp.]|uniref:L-aspartate oxidase n=1 Tax=Catonella sp. TaxID=2382125 RepID=UPI003F9F854A
MRLQTDVLIVGSGVAGLYCALNLPKNLQVTVITKAKVHECDSYLAQGGICVLRNDEDYDKYFEDTLRAGHYENRRESVEIMIKSSQAVIEELIDFGVDFARDEDGNLIYTKEGAHSVPRILFHEDITGKIITETLIKEVKSRSNISLLEDITMIDILTFEYKGMKICRGITAIHSKAYKEKSSVNLKEPYANLITIEAKDTVLACGGLGGLYEHSTNYSHIMGDALAIAIRHGIRLKNMDYIQIHPTTLYTEKKGRAFLITESVRGEGGILLNAEGKRFVNELLPRDVVTKAIFEEMRRSGTKYVWLSMENIDKNEIKGHFKHIYEKCLEEGFDCTKEPIPVVPAQHYFMGGIDVDSYSRSSMKNLYAVGETSCNGVHGRNRLASNSLLESLVFAKRASYDIVKNRYREEPAVKLDETHKIIYNLHEEYRDIDALFEEYRSLIINEIERSKNQNEQDYNGVKCG